MDVLAIADALAARYAPGTLAPPSGQPAIRRSTARLPNSIPTDPWVLVNPPNGELELGSGQVTYHLDFEVFFHVSHKKGDIPRDIAVLDSWLGTLLIATYAAMKLGVAGVMKAYPMSWELVIVTYAGYEFDAWKITVRVDFQENQVFVP